MKSELRSSKATAYDGPRDMVHREVEILSLFPLCLSMNENDGENSYAVDESCNAILANGVRFGLQSVPKLLKCYLK